MSTILSLVLLLSGQASALDDYEPATWLDDSRVLSCSIETLSGADHLVLDLEPEHGRELAIRRVEDNTWFFLIVDLAPKDVPQLMTPEQFSGATRVELPASFKSRAWAVTSTLESVLGLPGTYEAYVSENLESEAGGHVCTFKYAGLGPNNSFKGMPLRGTP